MQQEAARLMQTLAQQQRTVFQRLLALASKLEKSAAAQTFIPPAIWRIWTSPYNTGR